MKLNSLLIMDNIVKVSLIFSLLFNNGGYALDNGLARTPPMGWMHWERFRCIVDCETYPEECISENLFKRMTDLLVSEGYAAVGYEYIIIDDCWLEKKRDNVTGKLVEDRHRFPSGLKALANYVCTTPFVITLHVPPSIHARSLKFGLYQDFGSLTCAGYPGIIKHMALDAQSFADWDVDYVKLDGCYADIDEMDVGYPEFGRLLNKTGRPMVYSCSWPVYQEDKGKLPNYEALKEHCNLWRNWQDIDDSLESVFQIMDYFSKNQERIQPHAGPGHWNDPDMLILGNYGLTLDQSKLQMAVWSILAAPLIMSNDLQYVDSNIKSILQNKQVIAVNQDPLGIQGRRILLKNKIEVWSRPITPLLSDGNYSYAVAFVSRRADGSPYAIKFILKDLDLLCEQGYNVTDLYAENKFIGLFKPLDAFKTRINPNGSRKKFSFLYSSPY